MIPTKMVDSSKGQKLVSTQKPSCFYSMFQKRNPDSFKTTNLISTPTNIESKLISSEIIEICDSDSSEEDNQSHITSKISPINNETDVNNQIYWSQLLGSQISLFELNILDLSDKM
jgi:hypothetical protein